MGPIEQQNNAGQQPPPPPVNLQNAQVVAAAINNIPLFENVLNKSIEDAKNQIENVTRDLHKGENERKINRAVENSRRFYNTWQCHTVTRNRVSDCFNANINALQVSGVIDASTGQKYRRDLDGMLGDVKQMEG